MNIKKEVVVSYPDILHGPSGVACKNAIIGICIIWKNNALTQTGYILPLPNEDIIKNGKRICRFDHTFLPGEISKDLILSVVLYIKEPANVVFSGEEILINEAGVTIGEIDNVVLNFDSIYMELPIEELNSKDHPLWWVEFSQWEDPKVDLFSKENLCIYLNPHHSGCPLIGSEIKNLDMLIEIVSMTYFFIFNRLSEEDLLAIKSDIGLCPNSICSIMNQFLLGCEDPLHWESPERLLSSIRMNVAAMLTRGEEE
ncbi:hypothetical protein SDC9_124946 [bioreactor metagenome]|uniref:Uncharacterized protein n=1 Tax=bioreactor metagenome TaxID=1076179 RepID=A0A645CLP0_9ZZZZ